MVAPYIVEYVVYHKVLLIKLYVCSLTHLLDKVSTFFPRPFLRPQRGKARPSPFFPNEAVLLKDGAASARARARVERRPHNTREGTAPERGSLKEEENNDDEEEKRLPAFAPNGGGRRASAAPFRLLKAGSADARQGMGDLLQGPFPEPSCTPPRRSAHLGGPGRVKGTRPKTRPHPPWYGRKRRGPGDALSGSARRPGVPSPQK